MEKVDRTITRRRWRRSKTRRKREGEEQNEEE